MRRRASVSVKSVFEDYGTLKVDMAVFEIASW